MDLLTCIPRTPPRPWVAKIDVWLMVLALKKIGISPKLDPISIALVAPDFGLEAGRQQLLCY